jgi:hypothetical protein
MQVELREAGSQNNRAGAAALPLLQALFGAAPKALPLPELDLMEGGLGGEHVDMEESAAAAAAAAATKWAVGQLQSVPRSMMAGAGAVSVGFLFCYSSPVPIFTL